MKRMLGLAMGLLVSLVAQAAERAPVSVEREIKRAISDLPIEAVYKSPIPGLYELIVGRTIYYADRSGRYLIAGGYIFDTRTKENLTQKRLEEINRIDFSKLPLDQAFVSGDPNGKLVLAIFTDPDCPFCRRLERELEKLHGVKIYNFLYPLERLHPNARRHAEAIWCAKDRNAAKRAIMIEGHDLSPPKGCHAPIEANLKLGSKLGISGTPTLIAGDGRMHAGFMPAERLRAWLQGR